MKKYRVITVCVLILLILMACKSEKKQEVKNQKEDSENKQQNIKSVVKDFEIEKEVKNTRKVDDESKDLILKAIFVPDYGFIENSRRLFAEFAEDKTIIEVDYDNLLKGKEKEKRLNSLVKIYYEWCDKQVDIVLNSFNDEELKVFIKHPEDILKKEEQDRKEIENGKSPLTIWRENNPGWENRKVKTFDQIITKYDDEDTSLPWELEILEIDTEKKQKFYSELITLNKKIRGELKNLMKDLI